MRLPSSALLLLIGTLQKSKAETAAEECTTSSTGETICTNNNNSSTSTSTSRIKDYYRPKCKFYMAPSSIQGANLGVYTVEAIPDQTPLMHSSDSPSIIVTDSETHFGQRTNWAHHDYFWSGEGLGEFEGSSVEESVVTFGSLCNYHTYLYNVKPRDADFDDTITPRGEGSPGIGAYSYYDGYAFYTSRDVEAGEELFANYGEGWLDGRDGTFADMIPREGDFDQANEVIQTIAKGLGSDVDAKTLRAFDKVVDMFSKRAGSLVPTDPTKFKSIVSQTKKTQKSKRKAKALAETTILKHDVDWILEKGQCIDNLVPDISTIPHAGRGAFAQRHIAKDELIVPAPLNQMMDYRSLSIWELVKDQDLGEFVKAPNQEDPNAEPLGYQLITNYCFSHNRMSFLLCPATNAILMNHCSTRMSFGGDCDRYNQNENVSERGPNAKIRWAGDWEPATKEWLTYGVDVIDKLTKDGKRGLSFDVVAIRDIQPGDEVLIDYGADWEAAWSDHVANWEPPSMEGYVPVKQMEKEHKILRTSEELEKNPYPENIKLVCAYWYDDDEYVEDDEEFDIDYYEDVEWSEDGSVYTKQAKNYIEYGLNYPCEVLDRSKDGKTYTVSLLEHPNDKTAWSLMHLERILRDYPRESISFQIDQYTSDQHLMGVFRHSIGIPDEMLPTQFMDIPAYEDAEDDDEYYGYEDVDETEE